MTRVTLSKGAGSASSRAFDKPHFLFDAACDMPKFAEHELTVIELPPHLGELKLAEWREAEAMPTPAFIDLGELQLEPQP